LPIEAQERDFSLVLLDLDGLKQINDQHGHLVGNRALCRLGQILADCCRSVDTAVRQGGDEFAVVLPETGMIAARLAARRICDLLAKDTEDPALSVSVGVACYPRDADSIAALLYTADKALYAMNLYISEQTCIPTKVYCCFAVKGLFCWPVHPQSLFLTVVKASRTSNDNLIKSFGGVDGSRCGEAKAFQGVL
jgi:diguanylate cyclase (GGDEF)-like protein